jgi:hypothetical protein
MSQILYVWGVYMIQQVENSKPNLMWHDAIEIVIFFTQTLFFWSAKSSCWIWTFIQPGLQKPALLMPVRSWMKLRSSSGLTSVVLYHELSRLKPVLQFIPIHGMWCRVCRSQLATKLWLVNEFLTHRIHTLYCLSRSFLFNVKMAWSRTVLRCQYGW